MPIAIPSLDIEVARSCNLSCDGCSHFTNLSGLKTTLTADVVLDSINLWAPHISPKIFRVLGGEPLICPELLPILSAVRSVFSDTQLQLFTNGILFSREQFDDYFGSTISSLGVLVRVSVHSFEPAFLDKLKPARVKLKRWQQQYGLEFEFADAVTTWTRRYQHIAGKITPYNDNDTAKSWACCPGKWCKQLYNGKIYKCQLTAYLQDVIDKLDDSFLPYLKHAPISHTATPEEMAQFFSAQDEWVCAACPANPQKFIKTV
ncbi:MAG: radical SAM protein [Micrococcales bacterium]|nr:radical SAM protein [Micrococcales bacterium]